MIEAADSKHVDDLQPSPNFGPRCGEQRADILLLHYTGMISCARAISWLAAPRSRVSCHYVVDTDGRITQMVAECRRAWHAGKSVWAGETDINSRSIGIEIHNPGHDNGYPVFPAAQMAALVVLAADIVARNRIPAARVLAHSDVAPHRKIDPGEKFDWGLLAAAGIGHRVEPVPVDPHDKGQGAGARGLEVRAAQQGLAQVGYGVSASGVHDADTGVVLRAFQRRWRPHRIDGRIDRSTLSTLARVVAMSTSAVG